MAILSERLGLKMQIGSHTRLVFRCKLYSLIAIFFVLFTFVDTSSPHQCCEELVGFENSAERATTTNSNALNQVARSDEGTPAIAGSDSQPTQPATPSSSEEEDCFCCGSHVLPGLSFTVAMLHFKSLEVELQQDCLLTPPLRALYHPPRFV
jgi:hypothetical protein